MIELPKLTLPKGNKLLLLSCCTPCSCGVIEQLNKSEIDTTILFYNPNIEPYDEYLLRKNEQKDYAIQHGMKFVDLDYENEKWHDEIAGLESEPERGKRCSACFEMRLEKTAQYAIENDFPVFADILGISRWKDMKQVHAAGYRVAERYPELIYWDNNWRKAGGSQRMTEIARETNFYRQQFCGCQYSRRK